MRQSMTPLARPMSGQPSGELSSGQCVAIMQGRLLPPQEGRFQSFPRVGWEKEFASAKEAGLDSIEWIFDQYGEDINPLATDVGVEQMLALSRETGVTVRSLCADYFMDLPLVSATEAEFRTRTEKLRWVLERCQRAGITRMVLPLVDHAAIRDDSDVKRIVGLLHSVTPWLRELDVELHLETALGPSAFREFLDLVPGSTASSRAHDRAQHRPMILVNYDSGNSTSLGFHPDDEFRAYGDRIGSVHIKDRVRGGGTVPLGTGDTDFVALFRNLKDVAYHGDFVLQVARGAELDEVPWTRKNLSFLSAYWKRDAS